MMDSNPMIMWNKARRLFALIGKIVFFKTWLKAMETNFVCNYIKIPTNIF